MTEKLELSDDQMTALAHLSIVQQAANGTYKAQAGEVDKRVAVVASFIRTGQCVADDETKRIVEAFKSAA